MKRFHFSYHKCLTVYFKRVFSALYNHGSQSSPNYCHFNSWPGEFYQHADAYKVASLNNHFPDLKRLGGDFRATRFIRDPRDLVVSGYFYHQRGAEDWCNIIDPSPADWAIVNGSLPSGLSSGDSFSSYLQRASQEEGLIAEIEFRRRHFESMAAWPIDNTRIRLYRYEDIVGNEAAIFSEIFSFYELPWLLRVRGRAAARKYSAAQMAGLTKHIRNYNSNQWRKMFSPGVEAFFNSHHEELIEMYGYDLR